MTATPHNALLVVGGGPAGLEAVRAFREAGGRGPVTLVSADTHAPYNRPPLTKDLLRGETSPDDLPLEDDSFYRDHDVAVRLQTEVVDLDPARRLVRLADGDELGYDACVLATGSRPVPLPVDGAEHPDVHLVRWRRQGLRLRESARGVGSAVVVGSGFIGCEAAASLASLGVDVTVVSQEQQPQLERLGEQAARRIAGWLEADGVRILGGAEVAAVEEGRAVVLADGTRVSADLVLVAAGVRANVELAEKARLGCARGHVLVDASMRTSAPQVYAAGDVAFAHNESAGRRLLVEHWGEALRMGEIAGTCAAGGDDRWDDVPGFWSEIGDRTLKYAAWGDGHDEARLVAHGEEGFSVWYAQAGVVVGVLTHQADEDYEAGAGVVREGRTLESVTGAT